MDPITIGVDGHVLTGKYQGTRSTLTNLLVALGSRIGARRLVVYSDDPVAARATVGVDAFEYEPLTAHGSIRRLIDFPRLFRRDRVSIGVFQYIAPLTGRNIVFIHDILPLTHPQYFPWKMRLRVMLFFTLAIRRAAMVVVVSEDTRKAVAARYRLPPEKVRTVLNGPSFPLPIYTAEPRAAAADETCARVAVSS